MPRALPVDVPALREQVALIDRLFADVPHNTPAQKRESELLDGAAELLSAIRDELEKHGVVILKATQP